MSKTLRLLGFSVSKIPRASPACNCRASESEILSVGRGLEGNGVEQRLKSFEDLRQFGCERSYGQDADRRGAACVNAAIDKFFTVFGRVTHIHGHGFFRAADSRRHGWLDLGIAKILAQHADLRLDELLKADSREMLLRRDDAARKFVANAALQAEVLLDLPLFGSGEEGPAHDGEFR